ncbi:MAG: hypothetical protein AABZ74_14035 [Cyanobacteriota bacterium]
MSLKEIQHLLAEIYTNKTLRDDFFNFPNKIANKYNLNDKEIEEILKLKNEIDYFSNTLIFKRREEVKNIIYDITKCIKDEINELFYNFALDFSPKGIKKHLEDAYYFLIFLEKQNLVKNNFFLKELIKQEKANLKSFYLKPIIKINFFYYDKNELIAYLEKKIVKIKLKLNIRIFFCVNNNIKLFIIGQK